MILVGIYFLKNSMILLSSPIWMSLNLCKGHLTIPKKVAQNGPGVRRFSFKSTWTIGAKQFVVQEALDTTLWLASKKKPPVTPRRGWRSTARPFGGVALSKGGGVANWEEHKNRSPLSKNETLNTRKERHRPNSHKPPVPTKKPRHSTRFYQSLYDPSKRRPLFPWNFRVCDFCPP